MDLNPLIRLLVGPDAHPLLPRNPVRRVDGPTKSASQQSDSRATTTPPDAPDHWGPNRRQEERRDGEDRRKRQVPVLFEMRSGRDRRLGYRRSGDVEAVRQGETPSGGPLRGIDEKA